MLLKMTPSLVAPTAVSNAFKMTPSLVAPTAVSNAFKNDSLFGSTYSCEQCF